MTHEQRPTIDTSHIHKTRATLNERRPMAIQPEFEQEDPCAVYTREHAAHTPRAISRESAQQKLVELDKWVASLSDPGWFTMLHHAHSVIH